MVVNPNMVVPNMVVHHSSSVMSRRLCSKLFTLLLIFCTLKGVYNSLKDLNYRKIERAEDWGTKERVKSLFNLKQTNSRRTFAMSA